MGKKTESKVEYHAEVGQSIHVGGDAVFNFGSPPAPRAAEKERAEPSRAARRARATRKPAAQVATPPTSAITWLHLSDLHRGAKGEGRDWPTVRDAFKRDLDEIATNVLSAPDLVLFTGDLGFKGARDEYTAVGELLDWLDDLFGPELPVFAVPGNHDLARPPEETAPLWLYGSEDLYVRKREKLWAPASVEREQVSALFERFSAFHSDRLAPRLQGLVQGLLPGDQRWTFEKDGLRLGLIGLNSAWRQFSGDDFLGRCTVDPRQLDAVLPDGRESMKDDHHAVLLLQHHPPEWLGDPSRWASHIEVAAHATLLGHMHENRATVFREESNSATRRVQAMSLCGLEHYQDDGGEEDRRFGYRWGRVELVDGLVQRVVRMRTWARILNEEASPWDFVHPPGARYREREGMLLGEWAVPDALNEQSSDDPEPDPDPGEPPPLPDPLARLRAQVSKRADPLADFFRVPGGPRAISEVWVELRMGGELLDERRRAPGLEAENGTDLFGKAVRPDHLKLEDVLDAPHKRWVLLGEPGGGKSTLLRHVATELGGRGNTEPARLPILLRVGDLEIGATVRSAVIHAYGNQEPGALAALNDARRAGRLVLLVDGLDEAVEPDAARSAVSDLALDAGDCPVIVASRPTGYRSPGTDFKEVQLLPLGESEQLELLNRWVDDRQRCISTLGRMRWRPRLKRMVENPLLLTLAGLVMRQGHEVPDRRSELYRLAVKVLLSGANRADEQGRSLPAKDVAISALSRLALVLHGSQTSIYRTEAVTSCIRDDERLCKQIRDEREWGSIDAFLKDVARITGILVPVERGSLVEGYLFPHRTFREYLAATALVVDITEHGIGKIPAAVLDGAIRARERSDGAGADVSSPERFVGVEPAPGELGRVLEAACEKPATWAEVLALTCGLLGEGGADALLRRVAAEGNPELVQRVAAEAEGISSDTVLAVLGVERGGENWESRQKLLEELPALVRDPAVVVSLAWKFARSTSDGNDLWFARELLLKVAAGEVQGELGGPSDDVRRGAKDLAARVIADHAPDRRAEALRLIDERGWWKTIPAGSFLLGSPENEDDRFSDEGPQRQVRFTMPFRMLAVPVTNELYELFDPGHGEDRAFEEEAGDISEHPVVNVSWWEAAAFAEWLGGWLPTEPEWEYACRAGTTTRYWSGDAEADLARVGWYDANSGNRTHPVGEKPPNPWGLHDMHGNIWEWTCNLWASDHSARDGGAVEPPPGPGRPGRDDLPPGDGRGVRGGSWGNAARGARSACRGRGLPADRFRFLGFRPVLPAPSED